MKQIIRLGINRYIHLDTYNHQGDYMDNAVGKVFTSLVVICIAVITAGAMLGYDVTTFNLDDATRYLPKSHGTQVETKR
jgi:uncharacterized membrane protein